MFEGLHFESEKLILFVLKLLIVLKKQTIHIHPLQSSENFFTKLYFGYIGNLGI